MASLEEAKRSTGIEKISLVDLGLFLTAKPDRNHAPYDMPYQAGVDLA